MNFQKSRLFLLVAIVFLILGVIFYTANRHYQQQKNKIKVSQSSSIKEDEIKKASDWAYMANVTPKALEARQEYLSGNYAKSFSLYKEAASSTDDFNIKSSLDISAAGTLMKIDTQKAGEYYVGIVNNVAYPDISRGFALLRLAQFYKGNRDISLLKLYFKDPEIFNKPISEVEYLLYKDIYTFHPYGIAAAEIGKYELTKDPTKAKDIQALYSPIIDKNIEDMRNFEGMKILVPNTYMAKAGFYRKLHAHGAVTKDQVVEVYEMAHKETKVQGNKVSEQFNLLSYADFLLLDDKDYSKAEDLILIISNDGPTDMIKKNLSKAAGAKNDYKNLYTFYSSDKKSKTFALFFSQFGW